MSKSISSALGRLRLKYLCRCSCCCWLPPMFLLSPQPPRRSLLRRFRPPLACRCPRELRAWGIPHWRAGCAHFAYGDSFPVDGWSPPPCIRTRVHQEEAVTAIRQMKCALSWFLALFRRGAFLCAQFRPHSAAFFSVRFLQLEHCRQASRIALDAPSET